MIDLAYFSVAKMPCSTNCLRDRVTRIVHQQDDGTVLASSTYELGPRGELAREYAYDAALWLIEVIKRTAPSIEAEQSILSAEFKLGIGTFYRSWIKPGNQKQRGQAIAHRAKNFAYPPNLIFLLALKKGHRAQQKALIRMFRSQGIRSTARFLF